MDSSKRGHGLVLSDDDRRLIDAALAQYGDEPGDEDVCEELRAYLWGAW